KKQQEILMDFRLAFSSYGEVNWCEALGTVLANDEVVNGVSERGGHPVEKKKMRQWYLRITDYAERLLEGLETVNFSDAMKEMQRNWIGRSEGAELRFSINHSPLTIDVYTTRPDTIFGVDFLVLAPEHELVNQITTDAQRSSIDEYLTYVKSRSDRERMAEVKQITGCFTGAYAVNPFDGKQIPIWIAEYVLAGYGTGAIMAVPCGDQRDFDFATHFEIPITNIIGSYYNGNEANPTKEATLENSGFLNGLLMKDAIGVAINKIEDLGIGKRKVNYRMRDAGFSRQRYWGEPFPVIWSDGIAIPMSEKELPLELPFVEKYGPGKNGEGPLSNLTDWVITPKGKRETSTMPGYAGSSWYFLRYMDPHNNETFADRKATDYWNQVDVYIGGTEHAVGHLLYSRMWTKVLFDLGMIGFDEPYKKLVNQGMITGVSEFIYRYNPDRNPDSKFMSDIIPYFFINVNNLFESANAEMVMATGEGEIYFSYEAIPIGEENNFSAIRVQIGYVDSNKLDVNSLAINESRYSKSFFVTKEGCFYFKGKWYNKQKELIEKQVFTTNSAGEKMSKSKLNAINPNDLVDKYGADTFRMYEMFLGPVEQSKPWDTKGIEGVHRFLKKLWRLFFDEIKGPIWTSSAPSPSERAGGEASAPELKTLHKTIKKIEEDTERFSFNTAVSAFMVCVNELTDFNCHKKEILEPLLILLTPYAPHIAEELYHALGNEKTILDADYPKLESKYLVESEKEYPISINGKMRTTITLSLELSQEEVEMIVLKNEIVEKWLDGKSPKKIIFVKNKMVNLVI
ncbi:MAG: class I tRNA ligase family protein, partial [Ginsengibacter sp.]